MSLSQEPAFTNLKKYFVCGYTDITSQSYAGISGRHERQGNATVTTNGAGPHNLQLFMLSPDGTVLHCLPGYWDPRDLVQEMKFAWQLNKVYTDSSLNRNQKNQLFQQMQLAHINQHPVQMTRRSHMQGFDQQYEAQYKLHNSDTILDTKLAKQGMEESGHPPGLAFKTCDVILHERMAKRPFMPFQRFDVANFSDYGKPRYDKNENNIDAHSGRMIGEHHDGPTIGDRETAERITEAHKSHSEHMAESTQWGQSSTTTTNWGNQPSSAQSNSSGSGWGVNNYTSGKSSWGAPTTEKKMMKPLKRQK